MHTSTPIIQTNNISMHFTTQQRSRERLSRWIESSDFTNEIQGNVPRFTNEIQSNIPRLQRRRRRNLVDEEDAAIFWQEALSQDSIEPWAWILFFFDGKENLKYVMEKKI